VGENDLVFFLCEYGGVYLFLFIVLTVLLCMWGGFFVVMCGLSNVLFLAGDPGASSSGSYATADVPVALSVRGRRGRKQPGILLM
jgi:hypothetical protein